MPEPIFTISANGKDVTQNFLGAGMTMTITDGEGLKADTLQIDIDDVNGSVIVPETGAILNPVGGYSGRMRDFGLFSVDSVTLDGWPQKISISAKSVEAKSLAKQREPKGYPTSSYPTYGDIFTEIAGKIGVQLSISDSIKSLPNPTEAQAEEDGLEFLTRVGEKINAAVTIKSGRMVVVEKGEGKSVSGEELDVIEVAKGINILSYSVSLKDEPKHSEVESTYHDRKKNKRETTTASTGMDGPKFLIRSPHQNKEEAQRAADAKAKELVRAQATATFTIDGEPFAQSGAKARASGCRPKVDGLWSVKTVTHNFSATAPYTCSLQCEVPNSTTGSAVDPNASSTGGGSTAPGQGDRGGTGIPNVGN